MSTQPPAPRAPESVSTATDVDLRTILAAWHDATVEWERARDALQAEIRQLSEELQQQRQCLPFAPEHQPAPQVTHRAASRIRELLAQCDLYLSLLRRRILDDPGAMTLVQNLTASLDTTDRVVDDLQLISDERAPLLRPVKLRALVQDVFDQLLPRLSAQSITTTIDVGSEVVVAADAEMLRQAVLRLALNALDAMEGGGELVVTSFAGSHALELEIADSGPGLSGETRARIFEPLFTTKASGGGLGLAVVRRLVEAHGGDVVAANCPEGGAAFTLTFPRRALQAAA